MTNCVTEIKEADVIFVTGSNTTENHPVMGMYIRQAKRAGKKLIVADPVPSPWLKSQTYICRSTPAPALR